MKPLTKLLILLTLLAPAAAFAQSGTANPTTKTEPKPSVEAKNTPSVAINTEKSVNPQVILHTSMGDITIELYADKAPKTVDNFLQYVKNDFYNGTIFHRVIDNFMIQGGGFTKELQQKPTRPTIHNEADNGLSNLRGTLVMARTSDPHSASAQFFINVADNKRLDYTSPQNGMTWGYCVFGKVIAGLGIVDKIKATPTGAQGPFKSDVPVTPIVIEKTELLP